MKVDTEGEVCLVRTVVTRGIPKRETTETVSGDFEKKKYSFSEQ